MYYPEVTLIRQVGKVPAGTTAEIVDDSRSDEVDLLLPNGNTVTADRTDLVPC